MNMKKYTLLSGALLSPLEVGRSALIQTGGKLMRTSSVVAIHSLAPNQVRFETLNTHYTLLPENAPQVAQPAYAMGMAA